MERDEGQCQYCSRPANHIHHISLSGMGRKRTHEEYNLISLCWTCHKRAHTEDNMRRWCEDWSRERYGDKIDKLLERKWSDD